MPITGLENAYNPTDAPIPVGMTKITAYPNVSFVIYLPSIGENVGGGYLQSIDGIYRIDAAPWAKLGMPKMLETHSYTTTVTSHVDPYIINGTVSFVEDDGLGGMSEVQSVNTKFILATERGNNNVPYEGRPIKIWRCYPFSFRYQPEVNVYIIPHSLNFSVPARVIEYVDECCKGTYIKWLNEFGHYNYWLFPFSQEYLSEAENIFDVKRNIFDADKTSNFDTVGFTATKKMTIRDLVKKDYWFMFESLTNSPEVYVLKNSWQLGWGLCNPDHWIKIRQSDVSFERTEGIRTMAELEFEFELPIPNTIKSIV